MGKINFNKILNSFSKLNIVVIGDLMIDHYLHGEVNRISPEAPVPIVKYIQQESKLGGCANVSLNLTNLGVNVTTIGLIGKDYSGDQFKKLMSRQKLSLKGIISANDIQTIEKTRIVANHQQLLRIDRENIQSITKENLNTLIKKLKNLKNIHGIILSDYAKGIMSLDSFQSITEFARKRKIFVSLDPKPSNFHFYNDIDIMTPNHHEASLASQMPCDTEKEIKKVGQYFFKNYRIKKLMITRGEKGLALFDDAKKVIFIPTFSKSVFDVSGAGDTVIATFTASYLAKASLSTSAMIANTAAGIVVSKFGTESIKKSELVKALNI